MHNDYEPSWICGTFARTTDTSAASQCSQTPMFATGVAGAGAKQASCGFVSRLALTESQRSNRKLSRRIDDASLRGCMTAGFSQLID